MWHEAQSVKSAPSGQDTYSSGIAIAHHYTEWVVSSFKPYLRGNIVEIGIGHGGYYDVLSPFGTYLGIDIDERSIRDASARFPEGRFVKADILVPGFIDDLIPGGADSVISINVLEHIPDDATALKNLVGALKLGGTLMINIPALPELYNDLDRLAGHHRRYSIGSFKRLLTGSPIQLLKLCYFNPVGGIGWWLNRFRHHESLNSHAVNRQIEIFDKYILPFSKALDPLTRRFFGQSLVCIARRI